MISFIIRIIFTILLLVIVLIGVLYYSLIYYKTRNDKIFNWTVFSFVELCDIWDVDLKEVITAVENKAKNNMREKS